MNEGDSRSTGPHLPVMLAEVLENLAIKPGTLVVDATVGFGGHSQKIIDAIGSSGQLIGIDRDLVAVEATRERFKANGDRAKIFHGRFGEIEKILASAEILSADGILADLGVSSVQLDVAERGFSFRSDGPLDMRMDGSQGKSAIEFIEEAEADELEAIIREYGEDRFAGRIARAIKCAPPIASTAELAKIVEYATPAKFRHGRIHPATRTFQALRIAVNQELEELDQFLEDAPKLLARGGRLVVISYHSLEDRRVKMKFRELAASGNFSLPVRRVQVPSDQEIDENPRSRSAKLRVLEKIN